MTKTDKALAAMRRYRQTAIDNDCAARAIKRLVKTQVWRDIVANREAHQSIAIGIRLAGMGY